MNLIQSTLNQICDQILRPARAQYTQFDLGPQQTQDFVRQDIDVINHKHQILKVSIFRRQPTVNCIIYLHSLNGSRLEIFKHINEVLKQGYMLIAFDFAGSGKSDGDQVTYGFNEIFDLHQVILHIQPQIQSIILWGRSMGSVVALLYMQRFNNLLVHGLILDSPFISLQDVVVQMASKKTRLPNFLLKSLSSFISDELKSKVGFTLDEINCLTNISIIKCPAQFITSKYDTVVPAEQTEKLYKYYQGCKQIHYTQDDHNAIREARLIESLISWFKKKQQSIGTQIKQKIMHKDVPIKSINLVAFNKERSTTFDDKRQLQCTSPKQIEHKYNQLLQTQRSLYIERSVSATKEYSSSKPHPLRVSTNYYQPMTFQKLTRKTEHNFRYQ